MRIFLVEDEELVREGLKKYIRKGKPEWEVVGEAGDGELAYFKILEEKPDVVITDIRMPYMSGLELASAVRDVLKDIKIIILSGYGEFNYASEALRIGVIDYLLKPIFKEDLYKALDKVQGLIDEEQAHRRKYEHFHEIKEQHEYMECQQLFDKLVMGNTDTITLCKKAKELGIDIIAPYYNIVLLREGSGEKLLTDAKIKEAWDIYRDSQRGVCFDRGSEGIAWLAKGANLEQVTEHVEIFLEKAAEFLGKSSYYVGIGEAAEGIRNLPECFYIASKEYYHNYFKEGYRDDGEEEQKLNDRSHESVQFARDYIAEHYNEEITLNGVAEQVFLSASHLCRLFSKEEGMTFVEYLTKIRMEKAKEMLVSTNMKISEISGEIGYKDSHYFTTLFKRAVGVPPGDYRRRERILKR